MKLDLSAVKTDQIRLVTFNEGTGKVNKVYGTDSSFKITTPGCPGLFWIDQAYEIYDKDDKLTFSYEGK